MTDSPNVAVVLGIVIGALFGGAIGYLWGRFDEAMSRFKRKD